METNKKEHCGYIEKIFKKDKNQKAKKSPTSEHLLKYNHIIKTIKLIENINLYKELNIKKAIEMFKN